jgi:hypothetical protein
MGKKKMQNHLAKILFFLFFKISDKYLKLNLYFKTYDIKF